MLKDRSKRLGQYITIAVTKNMYDDLTDMAALNGKTVSNLCREMLMESMVRYEQVDPEGDENEIH